MTPKVEEGDLLLKQSEDGVIARLKMFIHLRQDLERVCNQSLAMVMVNVNLYSAIVTKSLMH